MEFTIKQARLHAGMTQEAMANALEVDRGTYAKIEKDPLKATVRQIKKISDVTGIPISNIFLSVKSTKVDLQE